MGLATTCVMRSALALQATPVGGDQDAPPAGSTETCLACKPAHPHPLSREHEASACPSGMLA